MKILGSVFFTLIFSLFFIMLLLQYWKKIKYFSNIQRGLLIFLRIFVIFSLIFLIINPWIAYEYQSSYNQNIDVIFDNSESMIFHYNLINLNKNKIRESFNNWANTNSVNLNFFTLSSYNNIELINDTITSFTDFSSLYKGMNLRSPDQVFLISDGQATVGQDLVDIKVPDNITFNVAGIGDIVKKNDISIKNIEILDYLSTSDSVKLQILLQSTLSQQYESTLIVKNDEYGNIFNYKVDLKQGENIYEEVIFLSLNEMSNINEFNIKPIDSEENIDNNYYTLNLGNRAKKKDILLLSSYLSSNSSFIKSNIESLDLIDLQHIYRIKDDIWSDKIIFDELEKFSMIILDDFPSDTKDTDYFDKIIKISEENYIPLIYIEGPKSNIITGNIINRYFNNFTPKIIESDVYTDISVSANNGLFSGMSFNRFPHQRRTIAWYSDVEKAIKYSDDSILFSSLKDRIFILSMPELAYSHFKSKIYPKSIISDFFKSILIQALYDEAGLISLMIDKNSLSIGNKVTPKIKFNQKMDIESLSLFTIVNINDTLEIIDCNKKTLDNLYGCTLDLNKSGEYTFFAQVELPNGKKIISNKLKSFVQKRNVEFENLVQNKSMLQAVSSLSGGRYFQVKDIDSILTNTQVTSKKINKNLNISGISTQHYWWFLIMALIFEWFIRKRLGLL